MNFRPYDAKKDREAIHRIWREAGWMEGEKKEKEAADLHIGAGRAMVCEVNGSAECLALTAPATIRYLDEDLPMCALTAVTTGRVVRKQGIASRLTALSIALDAAEGALVAALGVFDQGYYDRLGFGSGSYVHWVKLDPAQIKVKGKHRVPSRLTPDDWEKVHAARLGRPRAHGAINIMPAALTRAEMGTTKNPIGLGYHDGPDGSLSHFIWGSTKNVEKGPYRIWWVVYRSREEFLELMALIKSLGDQVRLVEMNEPPGIQMQDLLEKPFARRAISEKSPYESGIRAAAYYQLRICDLGGCLEHTHLPGCPVRFNLRLSDPIEAYLESDAPWRGVAGDYVVTLGPSSQAVPGGDSGLPTLTATVNAFTRLWLGVRPATGLSFTDALEGPRELLEQLDAILRLPEPKLDWDF